jgi:Tfp pilus assembly protein PilX
MSARHVEDRESGAALLVTVLVLSIVAALVAVSAMELTQQNTVTAAQVANDNEARTAALVGVAGVKDFLNTVQDRKNTATGPTPPKCSSNNGLCQIVSSITSSLFGNDNNTIIPPNGGLGAIGYFNGQNLSINNVSIQNSNPYIKATVNLRILGNTYQIAIPATSNTASQPAQPGLITVISQGISGQASATADAVLGPVSPAKAEASNTTLSLAGTPAIGGQITNEAPAEQHTYLQTTGALDTPTGEAPVGFTKIIQNSGQTQVTISANTLEWQSNILFIPPGIGQIYPRIEFQNITGNRELNNNQEYRLSPTAISQGVCTFSLLGCYRVPVFAPGTNVEYTNNTWTISGPTGSSAPALLIPGAAYFDGSVTLSSGLFDNAIISTGNIVDDATVYAPNYAGPTAVCRSKLGLFPSNFCGPQGTQFIPGSIGNIALYADGNTTIGNKVSVYGDVLSRGNLTTSNLQEYGFLVGEGEDNTLNGNTTINNESAPQSFNATPLNARQYSATASTTEEGINQPIGLLGLTWVN